MYYTRKLDKVAIDRPQSRTIVKELRQAKIRLISIIDLQYITFIENTIMQKVTFRVKDNFLFHKRDIHKKKEKVKWYRLTTWKNNT